jgi:hypothetical protein
MLLQESKTAYCIFKSFKKAPQSPKGGLKPLSCLAPFRGWELGMYSQAGAWEQDKKLSP